MTDRGRDALRQTTSRLEVGPSMMRWDGDQLVIEIDEISSPPLISRIRGEIRVTPSAITKVELPLTPDGAHVWRPFAPRARIDVNIDRKGWQWQGEGYFDANFGTRALEEDFNYWTWGRFPTATGATCFYDATRRDGSELAAGFSFDQKGSARQIALPPKTPIARSPLGRETRNPLRNRAPAAPSPEHAGCALLHAFGRQHATRRQGNHWRTRSPRSHPLPLPPTETHASRPASLVGAGGGGTNGQIALYCKQNGAFADKAEITTAVVMRLQAAANEIVLCGSLQRLTSTSNGGQI